MIRDKFKQWVESQSGEFTWDEAKCFYDSIAKGHPYHTGTAVGRLLSEFAVVVSGTHFSRGSTFASAQRSAKPIKDISFVYNLSQSSVVMADWQGAWDPDRKRIEDAIRDMIADFETEVVGLGRDQRVRSHTKMTRDGESGVVISVHLSPTNEAGYSTREYSVTVSHVKQFGFLRIT